MVRPYRVKGVKKRKQAEEEPEPEPEPELEPEEVFQEPDEEVDDDQLAGIPVEQSTQGDKPGVIFVLQRASLSLGKVGKALLSILDSPLNKAGRISALYVETDSGKLIAVNPHVRLPRTFKRFSGIMVQLLEKMSIRASGSGGKLLKLVKNPVTRYLPVNSRKIGFSHSSSKVVHMRDYVTRGNDDANLVFVVGAMAHGKIDADYVDDFISVSNYPLSAACCIGRICNALELKWDIL